MPCFFFFSRRLQPFRFSLRRLASNCALSPSFRTQCRFGDKLLEISVVCPQNGIAALKCTHATRTTSTVRSAAVTAVGALSSWLLFSSSFRTKNKLESWTRSGRIQPPAASIVLIIHISIRGRLCQCASGFPSITVLCDGVCGVRPGGVRRTYNRQARAEEHTGTDRLLLLITLLWPESRFGDELLIIRQVCPQDGTAVLKRDDIYKVPVEGT